MPDPGTPRRGSCRTTPRCVCCCAARTGARAQQRRARLPGAMKQKGSSLTGCPGEAAAAAGVPKPVLAGAAPKAEPGVPKGDAAPEPGVPNAGELEAAPNAGVLAAPKPPKDGVLAAAPNAGVLAAAPNAGVLVAPKAPKAGELCADPKAGCRRGAGGFFGRDRMAGRTGSRATRQGVQQSKFGSGSM